MAIATELLEKCDHFRRFVAYDLIQCHRPTFRSLRAKDLVLLARELDNWGAVDLFAGYLAGPCWRENQISDKVIHRWARSSDRWWRRAALVCTVPLNARSSGGKGDTPRTLQVCRMLIKDRDDMVVKAMSWALRALSKRDPKSVRKFITENQSDLAARVLREVRNKLETGLKNPRRKTS